MKKHRFFLLYLFLLSVLCGYLLSKASLIGRAGITLFYKEYTFLKTWWQGGLAVLIILFFVFFIQDYVQERKSPAALKKMAVIVLITGAIGLYLTFYDFRHHLSHRLLGERFHLGGYLFWVGWLSIPFYFLARPKKELPPSVTA